MTADTPPPINWIPLEANPEVLASFSSKIGLLPNQLAFHDIYGLDDDLLALVPQPVRAILLLYPITPGTEAIRHQVDEQLVASPPEVRHPNHVFYMRQTIGNACGTIALLHTMANLYPTREERNEAFEQDSFVSRFLSDAWALNPIERCRYLEQPPAGAPSLAALHKEAGEQGQSVVPDANQDVDLHFVAFVPVNGRLVELDGRKEGVVDHGACAEGDLLHEAVQVVKKFVDASQSIMFNLIAVTEGEEEGNDDA